jgi:N-acetylneuraminic acid mutarotase
MKYIVFTCLLTVAIGSCKKSVTNEPLAKDISASLATDFIPAPPYKWRNLGVPSLPNDPANEAEMGNAIFKLNGDHYLGTGFRFRKVFKFNTASKSWEARPSMSFEQLVIYDGVHFSFGSKIYYGLSSENPQYFAAYDPVTGVNTQLPDFPGTSVDDPICFILGSKAYLVSGISRWGDRHMVNQYWEFNFLTNQWRNKGSSPIGLRAEGSAYTINDKVYIGLGFTWATVNGERTKKLYTDWSQIDPNLPGVRITKASFPGDARVGAKGFMIGSTLHLGFGKALGEYRYDLYKYNASFDSWTAVASWPSKIEGPYGMDWIDKELSMFSVGNAAYLVKGGLNEFWDFIAAF